MDFFKQFKDLEKYTDKNSSYGIQISSYENYKNEYLVLSDATSAPFKQKNNRSVSICILLSLHLKKKIPFFKEDIFAKKKVGTTCKTCAIKNCEEPVT